MTRPYAPVITKTRTTTPVRPAGPVSPFSTPGTPNPFSGSINPFSAANPFHAPAMSAGGGGKSPFTPRNPFGTSPRNKGRKKRIINRRHIILPKLGRDRHAQRPQYYLPYEEICELYYWQIGNFTYTPGMGEHFTELAKAKQQHDNYENMVDCDELRDGWCWIDESDIDAGCEDDQDPRDAASHLHPLGAASREDLECLISTTITWMSHVGADLFRMGDPAVAELWDRFDVRFRGIRDQLLADPELLLGQPLLAGTVAINVLKTAGFDPPEGLVRSSHLIEQVRYHLGEDESVRDAFADLGALVWARSLEDVDDVQDELDGLEAEDAYVMSPDDFTFLVFDKDDLDCWSDNGCGLLSDEWLAVDATYHSLYGTEHGHLAEQFPFCIGWREILMKPYSPEIVRQVGEQGGY